MLKLSLGYLDIAQEKELLLHLRRQHPIEMLQPVVDGVNIPELAEQIWEVNVDDTVRDYIVRLVHATREHPDLLLGASPRGYWHCLRAASPGPAARPHYVYPTMSELLAPLVLAHRCLVQPESALRGLASAAIVKELLAKVVLDIGQT